ncbi:hypothetical protein T11_1392 [Trichinella zimbabwensis]|uniref:Uncharacterized protein n=1 Tax=Trichinella zimbabwensis TaxID=268475 RepID=A0A0V1H053_9BILA|nr:hypothetical protein T11_1392 [Trichinella zimbabwensis]
MQEDQMSAESTILSTGSSAVKRVLRRCVVCIEENSRCLNQIVGPLSKERLVETHAFDNVGIVFVGPLYVKEGKTITNGYIWMFTGKNRLERSVKTSLHKALVT